MAVLSGRRSPLPLAAITFAFTLASAVLVALGGRIIWPGDRIASNEEAWKHANKRIDSVLSVISARVDSTNGALRQHLDTVAVRRAANEETTRAILLVVCAKFLTAQDIVYLKIARQCANARAGQ